LEDLKERDNAQDLGIDRKIILEQILRKLPGGYGLDSSGSG
jgi:hypothetical protein